MDDIRAFSGSYKQDDVQFLLNIVEMEMTPVDLKEVLIQSGQKHYSEMISQEPEPTSWHLELFEKALNKEGARLAKEVTQLASYLVKQFNDTPVILVSLVRAGVPLGVMLQRALRDMGKESYHYGVSVIRDRGIDEVALEWIERKHGTQGIVFVDGWTGKGAISDELKRSLAQRAGYDLPLRLLVLADPCGSAWLSASVDDWLIPFGIMGAPVSGLISRSIWSNDGLHGCVLCNHLAQFECSQHLVDIVDQHRLSINSEALPLLTRNDADSQFLRQHSDDIIQQLAKKYDIQNLNRIKPGIAEATRAVLRRIPDHVLVRDINDPDIQLLVYLAKNKGLNITEVGEQLGNYRAVTIIKKVS